MRWLMLFLLLVGFEVRADDGDARLSRLDAIASEHAGPERVAEVAKAYAELGLSRSFDRLAQARLAEVDALFHAAQIAFFYTSVGVYLAHMEAAYEELVRRGAVGAQHTKRLANGFLQARRFARATALLGAGAGIPTAVDALGPGYVLPTIWRLQGDVIERQRIEPEVSVLVVAHPLCRYTNDAWNALRRDRELASILSHQALWVMPQPGGVPFDALLQWNASNPTVAIALVHDAAEWPLVDDWATPSFYFLRDGKRVAKVVGWPDEGNRTKLREAAASVGLLNPPRAAEAAGGMY